MLGLMLATFLSRLYGWRSIFYITGSLGLILAVVIYFGVREPERGQSEPEMENLDQITEYHFDKQIALGPSESAACSCFLHKDLLVSFPGT